MNERVNGNKINGWMEQTIEMNTMNEWKLNAWME